MENRIINTTNKSCEEPVDVLLLLKHLREKRKISRTELSRLTKLSTYQVEGLEGKALQNQVTNVLRCIKALGYKAADFFHLIENGILNRDHKFPRGFLGSPISQTVFQEGTMLGTYVQDERHFFCEIQLEIGKSLKREHFSAGDLIFGIVREGTLVIDMLAKQTVYKKDHFFIHPGDVPAEYLNGCSFTKAFVLLFCVKHPR